MPPGLKYIIAHFHSIVHDIMIGYPHHSQSYLTIGRINLIRYAVKYATIYALESGANVCIISYTPYIQRILQS